MLNEIFQVGNQLDAEIPAISIFGSLQIPGHMLFQVRLEYEHFPPKEPEFNKFFEVLFSNDWFFRVRVPANFKSVCKELAVELQLQLVGEGLEYVLVNPAMPEPTNDHAYRKAMNDEATEINKIFAANGETPVPLPFRGEKS